MKISNFVKYATILTALAFQASASKRYALGAYIHPPALKPWRSIASLS